MERDHRGVSFAVAAQGAVAKARKHHHKNTADDDGVRVHKTLSQRATALGFGMSEHLDIIRLAKERKSMRSTIKTGRQDAAGKLPAAEGSDRTFPVLRRAALRKATTSESALDDSDLSDDSDDACAAGVTPFSGSSPAGALWASGAAAVVKKVLERRRLAAEEAASGSACASPASGLRSQQQPRPGASRLLDGQRRAESEYKAARSRSRAACSPWWSGPGAGDGVVAVEPATTPGQASPEADHEACGLLFDGVDLGYEPKDPPRVLSTRQVQNLQEEARGWLEARLLAVCPCGARPLETMCVFDTVGSTVMRYALARFATPAAARQALKACRGASVEAAAQGQAAGPSWQRCSLASRHFAVGAPAAMRLAAVRSFARPGPLSRLGL